MTATEPRTDVLPPGECVCGKEIHESKAAAVAAVRSHRNDGPPCVKCQRGGRMHAYLCDREGANWHTGHTFWRASAETPGGLTRRRGRRRR